MQYTTQMNLIHHYEKVRIGFVIELFGVYWKTANLKIPKQIKYTWTRRELIV